MIASILDGLNSDFFSGINGCYSPSTKKFYGSTESSGLCALSSYNDNGEHSCYCYNIDDCYLLKLQNGSDCGQILTTYSDMLSASAAFCILCTLLIFSYNIVTCMNVCCKLNHRTNTTVPIATDVNAAYLTPPVGGGLQYVVIGEAVAIRA